MTLRATLGDIRFGTGLCPDLPPLDGAPAILSALAGPDETAATFPQESYAARAARARAFLDARQARRDSDAAEEAFRRIRRQMRGDMTRQLALMLARGVGARGGFRERLAWFWADHFTTAGTRRAMRGSITAFVEEAIRPHLGGAFPDMLVAAVTHPVMILYLDQDRSAGPNSRVARNRPRDLNENLAREVLELHTLGAGAGYTQDDVRQMAELLTGLGVERSGQRVFRPQAAEPGPETVFGATYGGADPARLDEIRAALRDLALRPETARHLSRKLAEYFLSDTPDQAVVAAMAAAYLDTGGDLPATCGAMLEHPSAWDPGPGRIKRPFHFIVSALRALGVPAAAVAEARGGLIRDVAYSPMIAMGQRWQGAGGPDGFAETDIAWMTPQALATRIGWSMVAPAMIRPDLPDPRGFVDTALGGMAGETLRWSAARAETRAEGVGLILASPAFQRS